MSLSLSRDIVDCMSAYIFRYLTFSTISMYNTVLVVEMLRSNVIPVSHLPLFSHGFYRI